MADAIFSALHLSDFHFGANSSQINVKTAWDHRRAFGGFRGFGRALASPHRQTVHDHDIAQAAAKFILNTFEPGCLMLLSGDMAATGTDPDLRVASQFLYGKPHANLPFLTREGIPTIAEGAFDIALVPGNHDRYQDDWGRPGSDCFERFFAPHWDRNSPVKVGVVQHATADSKLAIVAVDMCLPRGFGGMLPSPQRYGCGLAQQSAIDLLRTETEAVRKRHPGIGVCWMLHFPPSSIPAQVHPDLSLIDGRRVEELAKALGIRLIIAGHIHRSDIFTSDYVQVVCAGSASCSLEVSGNYLHYLEIRVSESGMASLNDRSDFKWDRFTGEFVASP